IGKISPVPDVGKSRCISGFCRSDRPYALDGGSLVRRHSRGEVVGDGDRGKSQNDGHDDEQFNEAKAGLSTPGVVPSAGFSMEVHIIVLFPLQTNTLRSPPSAAKKMATSRSSPPPLIR